MEKLYILNRDFGEGKGVNLENRKKVFGMLEIVTVLACLKRSRLIESWQ